MSILLESLNQSSSNDGQGVPNVGDSHFDDEMLSDEWLLKKLKFWKITAGILFFISISLTFSLYWISSKDLTQENVAENNLLILGTDTNAESSKIVPPVKKSTIPNTMHSTSVEKSGEPTSMANSVDSGDTEKQDEATTPVKEKYIPQRVSVQPSAVKSAKTLPKIVTSSSQTQVDGSVIDFESLSIAEQQEIPELEISSYAVSSNVNKSFVVLNGAFYGQGEIIAPNLVLVRIEKKSIVVRYKQQLIRKKYGL